MDVGGEMDDGMNPVQMTLPSCRFVKRRNAYISGLVASGNPDRISILTQPGDQGSPYESGRAGDQNGRHGHDLLIQNCALSYPTKNVKI